MHGRQDENKGQGYAMGDTYAKRSEGAIGCAILVVGRAGGSHDGGA